LHRLIIPSQPVGRQVQIVKLRTKSNLLPLFLARALSPLTSGLQAIILFSVSPGLSRWLGPILALAGRLKQSP
jgi:hypothetical protein